MSAEIRPDFIEHIEAHERLGIAAGQICCYFPEMDVEDSG